jgi:hypothetical protein
MWGLKSKQASKHKLESRIGVERGPEGGEKWDNKLNMIKNSLYT